MNNKYLLFIDSLGSGGAQNQVVQIANGLMQKGNDVTVVYYHNLLFFTPLLDQNNIQHILLSKSDLGIIGLLKKLRKIVRDKRITHLISFLEGPNFYAALLKLSIPWSNFRLIVSERSRTPVLSKLSKRFWIKKLTYHVSTKVMTNSFHERENLMVQFKIKSKKIFVLYNIVDLKRFKQCHGVVKKECTILSIGSISPMKNGICLIEALNSLNNIDKKKYFVDWYGEKQDQIKERKQYSDEMDSLLTKYSLSRYWNWKVPSIKIEDIYQKYNFIVLPSIVEGLPNVVCEAMASGIPIIISNVLDHSRLVNSERGFLFDPNNSNSLKEAIDKISAVSETDYKKMSLNSRVFAENTFSIQKIVNELISSC